MKADFKSKVVGFFQSPIRVLLFFCFLVFFPFPEFSESLIIEPLSDSVHLILGFLIFYFVKSFAPKYISLGKSENFFLIAVLLISLGLAGFIEFIQPYFGRGFSLHDMELSLFGSFCGYFMFESKLPNRKLFFVFSFVLGLFFAVLPVAKGVGLAKQKWLQFPVLVKSNSILNRTIKPVFEAEIEPEVGPCAILFQTKSLYGGISIPRGREDWSNYSELLIEFDSLSDSDGEIGLRIDDAIESKNYGDRYNDSFKTHPGLNTIRVTLTEMQSSVPLREFDLKKIRRIFLFSVKDKEDISICVRKIELKKSASGDDPIR